MGFSELPIGPLVQAMDKTVLRYPNLEALLRSDPEARRHYDELPDHVRERISEHPAGINSLDSLKGVIEDLSSGNGRPYA